MNEIAMKAGEVAMDRDPRESGYGFFSGGTFVLDTARVFSWFDTIDALIDFLYSVEPEIFDLEGDDLSAYQHSVKPILHRMRTEGLTDELREEFNLAAGDAFTLDWWGHFGELVEGKTEFSRNLIDSLMDSENESQSSKPILEEDMDEFVEFLKTCGV